MSHTIKILRNIAAGEDYQSLCTAIENRDYQTLYNAYTKLSQLLKEAGKEVEEKIDNLPRRNKEEDRNKFQKAFELRSQAVLPQWHWINSQIQKQNIMDGVVVSIGKMGDPITRTPAGKLVVLSGSKAKEGDKVAFTVVSQGDKIDFGRQFELTPDTFYFVLNQELHQKVKDSLDAVHKELESFPGSSDEENLSRMDEMLKMLDEVRELTPKMLDDEKERILNRVMIYNTRLLGPMVEKLALDFVSNEEEKTVRELCDGDEAKVAVVHAVPGLYSPQSFNVFKESLFDGDKIRGYEEILAKREEKLDTMDSALKFEEFKADISNLQPKAQLYIDGMERLFQRLQFKAKQLTKTIINDKTGSAEAILNKIRDDFSDEALGKELQHAFRSAEEYYDVRRATMSLKAKLGDTQCAVAEALLKPYLLKKVDNVLKPRSTKFRDKKFS